METLNAHPMIEWGVAFRPLPGETTSGDHYLVEITRDGVLAAVVDGLGHGPEASAAALKAIDVLHSHPDEPIVALVQRCHVALLQTRGVALSLAAIDTANGMIQWLAVGNVEGILLHTTQTTSVSHKGILLRGGVVGYQLPSLQAEALPIAPGDLLALATDGIASGFTRGIRTNLPAQTIADHILGQYARPTDDALTLIIRYRGIVE